MLQAWIAPAMFIALHDLLIRYVPELQLQGDAATHVTPIVLVRGGRRGKKVRDAFTVTANKVLRKLAGDNEPIFVREMNLSLTFLGPDVTFSYDTVRDGSGVQDKSKSQLLITGQLITLTLDPNDVNLSVFGFDRKRGRDMRDAADVNYTAQYELTQKVALSRRVVAMAAGMPADSVPARLVPFCEGVIAAFIAAQAAQAQA